MIVVLLAGVFAILLGAPAGAQETDAGIFGSLRYEDPESGDDIAVEGVVIEVAGADEFVLLGTTDADGAFRIVVPGNGTYSVTLDVETLPDGVNLRNPDNNPLSSEVTDDRDRRVLFPLVLGEEGEGGGARVAAITFRRVAQLTVEGLKQGCTWRWRRSACR